MENISSRLVPLKTKQSVLIFIQQAQTNQKLEICTYNRIHRIGITRRQSRPQDESVPKIVLEIDPLAILTESI